VHVQKSSENDELSLGLQYCHKQSVEFNRAKVINSYKLNHTVYFLMQGEISCSTLMISASK